MCQDITHAFIPSHSQTHNKNFLVACAPVAWLLHLSKAPVYISSIHCQTDTLVWFQLNIWKATIVKLAFSACWNAHL